MNQSPYNQFEPDARGVPPVPAAPAKPGPRRLLVPAVTVAVVAVPYGAEFCDNVNDICEPDLAILTVTAGEVDAAYAPVSGT